MPKRYSKQEIKYLKNNYLAIPYRDIAKQLNRPWSSISDKCRELGLRKHIKKEIAYIKLTPSFAYFLGCLCGDASILSNKIRLACKDKDFADEFYNHCRIMLSHSNINVTKYSSGNNQIYNVQISSLGLREYLIKNYGTFDTFNWEVPLFIKESNNEQIIGHFLRGLYDSEGSVRLGEIRLQTVSLGVRDISKLLNKLNISNRLSTANRLTTQGNKVYCIGITSFKNLSLFQEKIGLSIYRKQKVLNNYLIKHYKSTTKTRLLTQNKEKIAELYKNGYTLQKIADKFNISSAMAVRKYILMVLKGDYYLYNKNARIFSS